MNKLKKKLLGYFSDISSDSNSGSASGEFLNMKKISSGNSEGFWNEPPSLWEQEDVNDWIKCFVPFGHRKDFRKTFEEKKLDNAKKIGLLKYKEFLKIEKKLNKANPMKRDDRARILLHFGYLKYVVTESARFNPNFPKVLKKLLLNYPIREYVIIKNSMNSMTNIEESTIKKHVSIILSYCTAILDENRFRKQMVEYFENELNNDVDNKFTLELKLIIVDQIVANSGKQTMEQQVLQAKTKRMVAPLVNMIPFLKPEFGLFHIGIQIGKNERFYTEWTTSSLLIFRQLLSTFPVCTITLDPIEVNVDNYEKIALTIADEMYKWNTEKTYHLVNLNCQHFVMALCAKLGVEVKKHYKSGALKKFLDNMKKKGESDMFMEPSNKFVKKLKIDMEKYKDKRITFKTHIELDEFAIKLLKKCQKKKKIKWLKSTSEWKLLKSFDDVFWLRYFNDKDLKKYETYKCLEDEETKKMICPFIEIDDKDQIYQKIMRENEKWNEMWYEDYLTKEAYNNFMKKEVIPLESEMEEESDSDDSDN